jgi:hypothetical protein
MASPPTTIVPLPVVIAERRILSTAERVTVEVIINRHIASTIIGEVSCAVDCEVSIPIDDYVVARTKLIGISITINIGVSRPVDRNVSLAIGRYAVATTKLVGVAITINVYVSRPIHRDVSLAINGNVVARAKLLIPREVSLARRARPSVLIGHRV